MEVKVNFDEIHIKDETEPTLAKILMLQGEKGETGTTDYNELLNKPTKLSDFTNDGVFITNAVNDLANYYKKSETYTNQEINNLVGAIPKFSIEVVTELPTTDISTTTVYLVPSYSEATDIYKEYIYVNSKWELLGIQKADLTNYYNKSETDDLLNAKADISNLSTVATSGSYNDLSDTPNLLNAIYPVGSIYMSVNSTNPQTLFGGTWVQIKDTFLLAAGNSYSAGATGGESSHTLTTNEMPKHSHTRGTMDIIGHFDARGMSYNNNTAIWGDDSLFKVSSAGWSGDSITEENISKGIIRYAFQASNVWTGATSEVGGSAAHNNMPPYLAVYVWKRTA